MRVRGRARSGLPLRALGKLAILVGAALFVWAGFLWAGDLREGYEAGERAEKLLEEVWTDAGARLGLGASAAGVGLAGDSAAGGGTAVAGGSEIVGAGSETAGNADPASGDTASGDTASGGPASGDTASGDTASGGPASGGPASGGAEDGVAWQTMPRVVDIPLTNPRTVDTTRPRVLDKKYAGIVEIPSLKLTLMVYQDWSYPKLRSSPCRFMGESNGVPQKLAVVGHNYWKHFGQLSKLRPGDKVLYMNMYGDTFTYTVSERMTIGPRDIDDLNAGDWDLALITCTGGGRLRYAVKCS